MSARRCLAGGPIFKNVFTIPAIR